MVSVPSLLKNQCQPTGLLYKRLFVINNSHYRREITHRLGRFHNRCSRARTAIGKRADATELVNVRRGARAEASFYNVAGGKMGEAGCGGSMSDLTSDGLCRAAVVTFNSRYNCFNLYLTHPPTE